MLRRKRHASVRLIWTERFHYDQNDDTIVERRPVGDGKYQDFRYTVHVLEDLPRLLKSWDQYGDMIPKALLEQLYEEWEPANAADALFDVLVNT